MSIAIEATINKKKLELLIMQKIAECKLNIKTKQVDLTYQKYKLKYLYN